MNKQRRKDIERAIALLDEAKDIIETAAGEERDYYDAMPENMQGGEKGERAEQAADSLDECVCDIEQAIFNSQQGME